MKKFVNLARAKWSSLRAHYNDSPHRSFRQTPPAQRGRTRRLGVKAAWLLIVETFSFLKRHRRLFIWLVVLYALATYFLIGGVSQADYASLKADSKSIAQGLDVITQAAAYLGAAVTGGLTQAPSDLQRFLSGFITLIFWLATIWAVRMLSADRKIKLREAFYNGMTPMMSTLAVLLVVALQLIPAALGLFAFSIAVTQDWITSAVEGLAFGGAALLLSLLSLYWITGSIVATAIVALPGMYPLQAFVDARQLTMGKRWDIALRVVSVLIIEVLVWAVIMIPVFILDSWLSLPWLPLVPIAIQVMSGFSVIFTSTYLYKLYRSLL